MATKVSDGVSDITTNPTGAVCAFAGASALQGGYCATGRLSAERPTLLYSRLSAPRMALVTGQRHLTCLMQQVEWSPVKNQQKRALPRLALG